MKSILVIILLFQTSMFAVGQSNDTIYYYVQNKISWGDFREVPADTGNVIKANLATTMQMRTVNVNIWTGVTTFEAYAIALPNLSWVEAGSKTNNLLRHLQLYFDISELFARKLETEINGKKINGARKNKMQAIFTAYEKLLLEEHKRYATDTKFGNDQEKQKEWEMKIMGELD